MKIRAALLLCLMSAAALSLCGAYRSLNRAPLPTLPEEVAARFVGREDGAEYFLRAYGGYVAVFSGGRGRIELQFDGYDICHNAEEVIAAKGYEPERDLRNKADSVFCSHGSGVTIPWNEVPLHMHLPFVLKKGACSMNLF